jgi:hypothetical protein
MKVKDAILALMKLPPDHELHFVRGTHHGEVELEFERLEVKREIRLVRRPLMVGDNCGGEYREDPDQIGVIAPAIEELSERCIMVLS